MINATCSIYVLQWNSKMYRYAYEEPQNKVSGFLECKRGEKKRERDWSDHSHHDNGHGGNQGVG